MELREALRFVHIVAAMTWVGGAFLAAVFAARTKKAAPGHALGFARGMQRFSVGLFIPASLVVLGMGIWLVIDSDVIEFTQAWIVIGLGAVAASLVLALAIVKPNRDRGVAAMEAGGGPQVGLIMRRVGMASRTAILLQFIAVWAMVTKPGL